MSIGPTWRKLYRAEAPGQRMMHSMARLIRDHVIRYPDNNDGVIFKGCPDPVAWLARLIGIEPEMMDLFAMGVQVLIAEGYLSHSNGTLSIKSFAKYQGNLSPAERQKKSRETRKMSQNVTPVSRDVTSTCHALSHLEQNRTEKKREEQNTHSEDLSGPLACERAPVAKSQPVKQNPNPIPECACESESKPTIPATGLGLGIVLEASSSPGSPPVPKPTAESNSGVPRKADPFRATFGAIPGPETQIGKLWSAYLDNAGAGAKSARLDADRVRILDGLARDDETPETIAMATRGAMSEDWGRKHCASLSALFGKRDQFEKYLALGKALCKSVDPDAARNARVAEQQKARAKADAETERRGNEDRARCKTMGYPNLWTMAEAEFWCEAKGLPLHKYDAGHECHQKRKVAG